MTMQGGNGESSYLDVMGRQEQNIDSQTVEQAETSKSVDEIKVAIDGENVDKVSNLLTDDFWKNLQNGLHPNEIKKLKNDIENIEGYGDVTSPLNKVYKYVLGMYDAFDVGEEDTNDHESVTETTFDVSDFLSENEKVSFNRLINLLDARGAVLGDEKLLSQISAIKGILKNNGVSGGIIVNMAEFLGIDINSNDGKYNRQGKLSRLGKRVFSIDNSKGLYTWLLNKANEIEKFDEITKFKADPFGQFSVVEMSNDLLKLDNWNGLDAIKNDNTQVSEFCKKWGFDIDNFVNQFNEKNKERVDKNREGLKKVTITQKFEIDNVSFDANNQLVYYESGHEILLDGQKLLELVKGKISPEDIEGGDFVSNEELQNILKDDSVITEWLGQIKMYIENEQKASDAKKETAAVENLSEDAIEAKMWGKPHPITKKDVIDVIDIAKNQLLGIESENQNQEIIDRINYIITVLKDPGSIMNNKGHTKIVELQEKMKNVDETLVLDGKFGPRTLAAMKKYISISSEPIDRTVVNDSDATETVALESVETSVLTPRQEAINLLTEKVSEIPGYAKILFSIAQGDEDGLRDLQLNLLPVYRGKVDGKFGPQTLAALKTYISNFQGQSDLSIRSLASLDNYNPYVKNIVNLDEHNLNNSFVAISNGINYKVFFHNGAQLLCNKESDVDESSRTYIKFDCKYIGVDGGEYNYIMNGSRLELNGSVEPKEPGQQQMENIYKAFNRGKLFDIAIKSSSEISNSSIV